MFFSPLMSISEEEKNVLVEKKISARPICSSSAVVDLGTREIGKKKREKGIVGWQSSTFASATATATYCIFFLFFVSHLFYVCFCKNKKYCVCMVFVSRRVLLSIWRFMYNKNHIIMNNQIEVRSPPDWSNTKNFVRVISFARMSLTYISSKMRDTSNFIMSSPWS